MPGLRENLYERLSHEPIIDEEFQSLIPKLNPDEFAGLEASILAEGCRDAIILWGNIIVDGHNRYRICKAHNIPYKTKSMDFKSREDAKLWMLQNQLARRNLTDFQRIEIVRQFEAAVKAQAKERQRVGQGGILLRGKLPEANSGERATDELGKLAGVSRKTYEHAAVVIDNAPEEVIKAARNNELSINAAHDITQMPQDKQQEVIQRIASGEQPKKVVADVKRQSKKHSDMEYWNALKKKAQQAASTGQNIDAILAILNEAISILENASNS